MPSGRMESNVLPSRGGLNRFDGPFFGQSTQVFGIEGVRKRRAIRSTTKAVERASR